MPESKDSRIPPRSLEVLQEELTSDPAEPPRWKSFADELPDPIEQLIWLLHLRGPHRLVIGPKKAMLVTAQEASWSLWTPVERPPVPEIVSKPAVPARPEETRGKLVDQLLPLAQEIEDMASDFENRGIEGKAIEMQRILGSSRD